MSSSIISLVLPLALAGYGLWKIFAELQRFHRTRTWPKVSGRITGSQVKENSDEGTTYGALIEYEYHILGFPYHGAGKLIDIETSFSKKSAEDLCEAYPAGRRLLIAYNPQRIEQSEIADDAQCKLRFSTIVGAMLFIAFGLTLAILFER